ncbi:MAG: class I SAM-dependent methyltransferase [Chloroflexota bacterium]
MMKRLHLFEVMDQSWCPPVVRDAMTDFLRFTIDMNNPYETIIPQLSNALKQCQTTQIIDLCAGAGGPWFRLKPLLEESLGQRTDVILTDMYPHRDAIIDEVETAGLRVLPVSVDARHMPFKLTGFRTLFAGLHHFRPTDAQAIIRDAVEQRQGIGVFEATQRRPLVMLLMIVPALMMLFVTPFIRPFRWSRLVLTYLVPLLPLCTLFDGVVSCFRTYTPAELQDMVADFQADYEWEIGEIRLPGGPIPVTYLIGYPKVAADTP